MAVLTEEQSMLRDAARTWTQEKSPVTAFRKMRDSGAPLGYDPAAFAEMAEMGWTGVIIPEEYGGSDFGYLSLGLILEETGRTLTASPILSSALASASAIILGGSVAQKEAWLPKIASGEAVGALAVDEGPHHAPAKVALAAAKRGGGYTLNGTKTFVLEGMAANVFVVSARTSGASDANDGITLFLVPADAARPSSWPTRAARRWSPSPMSKSAPMRCWATRTRAMSFWRRCSIAPARAFRPRCWGPRSRPSRPRSTISRPGFSSAR